MERDQGYGQNPKAEVSFTYSHCYQQKMERAVGKALTPPENHLRKWILKMA